MSAVLMPKAKNAKDKANLRTTNMRTYTVSAVLMPKAKNAKDKANLERHWRNGMSDATWHRMPRFRDSFDSAREYQAYQAGFNAQTVR